MQKSSFNKRYIALIGVFCLLCAIYTVRLLGYELSLEERVSGRLYDGNTYQYTVTVPAKRGDICDRDGKIIATVREAYSMTFNYWSMPGDTHENNRTLLVALEALEAMENSDAELKFTPDYATDHFPFEGSYPYLKPSAALSDSGSKAYKTYQTVLDRREWTKSVEKPEDIIAKYIKKYAH